MYPSSFFSFLAGSDGAEGGPPPKPMPFANAPVTQAKTYTAPKKPPAVNPDADVHFSLPKRRPPTTTTTTTATTAAGGASDGASGFSYDALAGDHDKPNMLKEWCGILYYSARDVTLVGYKKLRDATTAGLNKAAFEDESWFFFNDTPTKGRRCGHVSPLYKYYAALPTTQTCTWMLPRVPDAPLVMHLALFFVGLEAIQVTSFYFRYRSAVKKTEEALLEADLAAEAEEDAEDADDAESATNGNNNNDDDSVHGGDRTIRGADGSMTSARGTSEQSTARTARARLPRGSSRAMHRLCSYWALVEKAVRQAPHKDAGVPTTAAALGRFFKADVAQDEGGSGGAAAERPPASTTSDGANARFTSDGVPHGAEKVLVLSDEHAFPVFHRSYDADSATTTTNATMASSMDALPPMSESASHPSGGGGGGGQRHASPQSAPRMLPPMYPSADSTLRSTMGSPTPPSPPPAAAHNIVVDEIAQPWHVFHALWTDSVRYSVNYTEMRQLLLSCSVVEITKLFEDDEGGEGSHTGRDHVFRNLWRSVSRPSRQPSMEALSNTNLDSQVDSPLHNTAAASFSAHCVASPNSQAASPRFTDGRVCVACIALTWYLSLIREVYEAVVVYQDVQRCADALEELEEYQRGVYQRGVEVGAEFFEEALRCAQPSQMPPRQPSQYMQMEGGSGYAAEAEGEGPSTSSSRRRLLIPQVGSGVDVGHDVSVQQLPPIPSQQLDEDGGSAAAAAAAGVAGAGVAVRGGPSRSNPLAFDFSPSPTIPLPPHRDRSHFCVTLRGASPRACWAELTAALAALLRRRRLMELACVRSLFCYMYTGSSAKLVSFTILALLTSLSSRVAALGQATREAISTNLDTYYRTTASEGCGRASSTGGCSSNSSSSNSGCDSGGCSSTSADVSEGTPAGQRILALFLFECTRLAVNTVLAKTTNEYITLSASQRRNTVKAELYEALTRMPLAFFDLHSYDEVEQIVYYVNDIEGVEVHVHNYVCGLITSLFATQHAMRQLPFRARLLVGVTVAASFGVKYIGQKVTAWTQTAQKTGGVLPPWLRGYGLDGTVSATAELDAQVEENMESNARQGGVMLRGLDIVAVLPQLRPYAADLSLMRWWTDHTRMCGAASGSTEVTTLVEGILVLPRQLYGKLLPALGGAMLTFADWVLPTVVSSYGASMAFSGVDALSLSNRLIEAMRTVGDTVDTVIDARRVAEVVLVNAYKANVLEKVLDQRRWEPTTMDYMKDFVYEVPVEDVASGSSDAETVGAAAESNNNNNNTSGKKPPSQDVLSLSQRRHGLRDSGTSFALQHQQALAKSFRRSPATPPSFTARMMRRLTYTAAWLVAHSPPMLAFQAATYLVRGGLRRLGLAPQDVPKPSALAGADTSRRARSRLRPLHHQHERKKRDRHRRHRREQQAVNEDDEQQRAHLHQHHKHRHNNNNRSGGGGGDGNHDDPRRSSASAHTPQLAAKAAATLSPHQHDSATPVDDVSSSTQSPFLAVDRYASGGGSVSDGNCTEAYYSDVPPGSQRVDVSSFSCTSSSSCADFSGSSSSDSDYDDADDDDSDLTSEAAAAAAAAVLVHATVHAVTVQNLQFYYPTAPTVPVFPKPITCTFTLQSEEWMSPSLTSPSSQSNNGSDTPPVEQMRGRLVCLVGPSGHGKSTLLSLMLGMYTHYGASVPRGCTLPLTSPSAAWAASNTTVTSSLQSDSEEVDTVSFGSPRVADPSALPGLPPDIILTLRMPRTSHRSHHHHNQSHHSGNNNNSSSNPTTGGREEQQRGQSRPLSRSDTDVVEEQLPVSVIPRDILRGNLFSFVPQSPVIFSGATIAHNISLENFISLEQEELLAEIAQCAAWAHCEYIQRFPQGLMTYIADSGTGAWSSPLAAAAAGSGGAGGGGGMVRLSGGQAQRLMMARALFHGRRGGTVLVMDEPTASLDHEVKLEILAEWRELLDRGIVRGMICATHDADLINVADEVVRLP